MLFGPLADRFVIGRAVLVASPNEGTPLASPDHVTQYTNWLSNVLELFPENPFTTGMEFVSEALSWIAHHIVGGLPGLASMDNKGDIIRLLQAAPSPPNQAYSSLVANFEPDATGAAADHRHGSRSIFCVSQRSRRADRRWLAHRTGGSGTAITIPGDRVGCFGLGGNLTQQKPVNHVNFFEDPGTVDFLVRALRGQAHPATPIIIEQDLPSGKRRSAVRIDGRPSIAAPHAPVPAAPIVQAVPAARILPVAGSLTQSPAGRCVSDCPDRFASG